MMKYAMRPLKPTTPESIPKGKALGNSIIPAAMRMGQATLGGLFCACWMGSPAIHAQDAFEPQNARDCLRATVCIKITDSAGKDSYGSGFFLNEGKSSYIYTTARVIDGAKKIEIVDRSGAKVTGIEWVEAFAEPFGSYNDGPISGDGVRLKLDQRREVALSLATAEESLVKGAKLLVLGDNAGAGIEVITGTLLAKSNDILRYDFKTKSGSSGGAVLDAKTLKVIALNIWCPTTWGPKNLPPDPFKCMLGMNEGGGLGFGVVLQKPEWEKFPIKDYLAQKKTLQRLRNNLELMILLSYLVPVPTELIAGGAGLKVIGQPKVPLKDQPKDRTAGYGFLAASKDDFVAGMKVGDAILHHKDNLLVRKLLEIHDKVDGSNSGNMKISSADLFKIYVGTLDSILREREAMMPDLQKDRLSFYHQSLLKRRFLAAGDLYYATWLAECRAWFKQQGSAGGSIPLREWETLPSVGAKLAKEIKALLLEKP